ncbi:MAG: YggT family protein [Alphaproteobacteria bacterium]|nr:YggT family protein [Alphaproteobacteria bacterium]
MAVNPIVWLIASAIEIYVFFVIAHVILGWLVSFEVVNLRNRLVYMIYDMLFRITEPALKPIRRRLPRMQVDVSPLVLILLLYFVRYSVIWFNLKMLA